MVGDDYFSFFGIKIIKGRDFSKDIATDAELACIINETAAKRLGWRQPIGKQIKSEQFESKKPLTVIGVVKDFHNGSLHEEIRPSIYKLDRQEHTAILVQVRPYQRQDTIAFLESQWKKLPTHLLFNYYFLDDALISRYSEDRRIGKAFAFSSILAVVIACFGLFGLASFMAERRKREMSIRRVLGASVADVVYLLSMEFSKLVLIANVIGWPFGYYVIHRWLQSFAYRIGISWWAFVIAAILVFTVTLLTSSYWSLEAATTNPADILRYE
jgi:putative ABC transport system permease protein